jgi:predicted RNA-binding Zn ribbon-like protein
LHRPGRSNARVTVDDADLLIAAAGEMHAIFVLTAAGKTRQASESVNDLLKRYGTRPQLDPDRRGGYQLHFHGVDDSVGVGWSAGFAAGLAIVIGSDMAGRLGVCAAPACDRVYVDTSRNNKKRFCSTTCQNRVKAAAFRARHRP